MLIGDPLGEGSTASSTDNELWRVEIPQNERELTFFFLCLFFFFGLAGNFPLTSVRWSLRWLQGN